MKRAYLPLLNRYLSYFPCVALVGPRQCGKTTFLKELPKSWKRFDLENAADLEMVSRDPDLFLKLNPGPIAIDEAQGVPSLFPALRVAIDRDRKKKGRFVITGSSSPSLNRSIAESLAGRVGVIEMAPFSCLEAYQRRPGKFFYGILNKKKASFFQNEPQAEIPLKESHRYWLEGGYPEPWLIRKKGFHDAWMSQYLRNHIERDIGQLFPRLNRNRFRRFFSLLAGLSGTIINYSEVGRSLGVSPPTAQDYFDIAHGTFLWRQIPAFHKNVRKRIVKHPRGYLRDTGLLHYLLKIPDLNLLLAHPKMGASWEGLVVEEIVRGFHALGADLDFSYYRTGGGAEVDLVLEGQFGRIPIEIKHTQTVPPRDLRSLHDFIQEFKCDQGFVINNDDRPRRYSEKIIGIPFGSLCA